jgi:Tfp pilus assembly protein PilN
VTAHVAQNSRKSRSERRKSLFLLTEAQAVLTWGVIMALAALVGGIYLFQTSSIARVGRQVQLLRSELNEVKRLNADLERDIAEAQTLDRLQEEALLLGFNQARPEDVEFVVIPDYPVTVAEPVDLQSPTRPVPPESIGEAVWILLRGSIGDLIRGESQ